MKTGDYFFWTYKQHVEDKRLEEVACGTLYWCCARKAIFDGTRIRDLYWSTGDNRSWTPEKAAEELDLEYLGNADDLETTRTPEYYDQKDIVNLTHPNSFGNQVYVRKGAKRSREAMKKLAEAKLEEAKCQLRRAQRDIERYENKVEEVKTAEDLEKVWI